MNKLMKKIKNNKGFTLVELIVVIAVLAIITVVAAPQYIKYVEKSRIGTDENAIGEIAHIAEIEWVALKAKDVATAAKTITVSGSTGYFVISGSETEDSFEKAIADIVGSYKVKSKHYLTDTPSFQITISENGVASWTNSEGETVGNAAGNAAPSPTT